MSDINKELGPLLHAMCFESLENPNFEYKKWEDELKALFKHGVCVDCNFESDHYCERVGSPVIKMNQTGPDTTDKNFGCTLFEPKEKQ